MDKKRRLEEDSASVEKKLKLESEDSQKVDFKGIQLYNSLNKYVLPEYQLRQQSFPRPLSNHPGKAIVYHEPPFNHPIVNGVKDAFHHPDHLNGYVKTKPKEQPKNLEFYGIYSVDCEMCLTTIGRELTKITVIDHNKNCVYETLVKPTNKIIDYKTQYSGIKQGDLDPITTTLNDVQKQLLSIFNDKTILIGHGLDNDFKALRLFHETVIDTLVVYPHSRGWPYKNKLSYLAFKFLNKSIQKGSGHNSREDAVTALELMLLKVKQ